MERHRRDKVERRIRIFSLHTGKNQFDKVFHNPQRIFIFKSPQRGADSTFVTDGGPGTIKGRRFAGAGEAGVVVLNVARNRIAAESAKRRFDLGGVGKTVPADVFHGFRRRRAALNTIARIKKVKKHERKNERGISCMESEKFGKDYRAVTGSSDRIFPDTNSTAFHAPM